MAFGPETSMKATDKRQDILDLTGDDTDSNKTPGDASTQANPGSITARVQQYSQDATIHAVKYAVDNTNPWRRRLFWVTLLLISTGCCLTTLIEQFRHYLSYPTKTSTALELRPSLAFPAVTICNLNHVRQSALEQRPEILKYMNLFHSMANLCHQGICQGIENSRNMSTEEALWLRNASHSLETTLFSCWWDNVEQNCSRVFEVVTTEFGVCFTFNSKSANEEGLISKYSGSTHGLRILADVEQGEYSSRDSVSAGLKVVLHEYGKVALVSECGFQVSPGFSWSGKITATRLPLYEYLALLFGFAVLIVFYRHLNSPPAQAAQDRLLEFSTTEVQFLTPPFKAYGNMECLQHEIVHLQHYGQYDINACVLDCRLEYLREKCGCKGIYDPESFDVPYCSLQRLYECYLPNHEEFLKYKPCTCQPNCEFNTYDAQLSMAYYPSDAFVNDLQMWKNNTKDMETYRKNYLELKLYYSTFVLQTVTQEPEYTFPSILASLGGQMGLFMGISILSLVELGELIFGTAVAALRRKWRQQPTHINSDRK